MASVAASEAARAQDGNLRSTANCNLEWLCSPGSGAEVPSNGPPERVIAPYVVPVPNEQVYKESGCLVLQP
jgi:hypothetical protein